MSNDLDYLSLLDDWDNLPKQKPLANTRGNRPSNPSNGNYSNSNLPQNQPEIKHEWQPPTPLTKSDLPAFPVHCLPHILRDFAKAVAESTQTPICMTASILLAIVATAIQGKYIIQGKKDWTEQLCIFIICVMLSAERKSAVLSLASKPLYRFEQITNERDKEDIARSRVEKRMLEKSIDALLAQAAKDSSKREDLFVKQDELTRFVEKKPLRLFASDATPEAITGLLVEYGKITVLDPEGGIFATIGGRYSNGVANIDCFLKGHNGETLKVDRRGRPPESIDSPCLTVCLCVQPQVLGEVMSNAAFDGRGLLNRFLYCIPASMVGSRRFETEPIPNSITGEYEQLIFDLLQLEQPETPHMLELSPEAYALLKDFDGKHEPQIVDELHNIQGWAGKLVGATLRIAGLLHISQQLVFAENTLVSGETMVAAIEIANFFTKHAEHAKHAYAENAVTAQARYILGKIENRSVEKFTKSELMKICRRYKAVDELTEPLKVLAEHDYIRISGTTTTANRVKVDIYTVNPLFLQSLS